MALWTKLRVLVPLPNGLSDPEPGLRLPLDPPRYHITFMTPSDIAKELRCSSSSPRDRVREMAEAASAFHALIKLSGAPSPSLSPHLTTVSTQPNGDALIAGKSDSYGTWKPYLAPVVTNCRLTSADHFQAVQHIELDIESAGLLYRPGDILTVLPQVSSAACDAFLARMDLHPGVAPYVPSLLLLASGFASVLRIV